MLYLKRAMDPFQENHFGLDPFLKEPKWPLSEAIFALLLLFRFAEKRI